MFWKFLALFCKNREKDHFQTVISNVETKAIYKLTRRGYELGSLI